MLRGRRFLMARSWSRLLTVCVVLTTLLLILAPESPPSITMPLPPSHALTHRRLQAHMLFANSGIHNMVCERLRHRNITQKTKLRALEGVLRHSFTSDSSASEKSGGQLDCKRWRQERGFERWPVTLEEEQFPLAFSFKLHKDSDMFERLLSVLWRPHNLYCVHVDRKTPEELYERFVKITQCFDNVMLTKSRVRVVYASISSLEADLECIKVALQSSIKWNYHLNLCGQDFPLKTNLEMVQILSLLNGNNDVENYPPGRIFIEMAYKYKAAIANDVNYMTAVLKPPFQGNMTIHKGSAYNILSRRFLEWTLKEQIHKDFVAWLNDTWAPDELFWATISNRQGAPGSPQVLIRHSDNTVLNKAVAWRWDPYRCFGVYVHDVCVFSALDLPWLLSRHELIANKFNIGQDSTVLDCLEAELERRAILGFKEWLQRVSSESGFEERWQEVSQRGWLQGVSHQSGFRGWLQGVSFVKWLEGLSTGPDSWSDRKRQWPRLSSLDWPLYQSLPQFSPAK